MTGTRETRSTLEVAITSPTGAARALAGGADRVELCVGLELGGLTPSQGLIEATVEGGLPVQVLVRVRPGDFVFDADEISVMEREVRTAVRSGAAGVVIGALTAAGAIDLDAIDRLADAARGIRGDVELTVHRAIDQASDPVSAAASLTGHGIHRILTSGGAARAGDGIDVLRRMAAQSEPAGAARVMAGGGVRVDDVPALLRAGVAAIHISAKRAAPRAPGFWIPLGAGLAGESSDTHFVTDGDTVAAVRAALDASRPPGSAVRSR